MIRVPGHPRAESAYGSVPESRGNHSGRSHAGWDDLVKHLSPSLASSGMAKPCSAGRSRSDWSSSHATLQPCTVAWKPVPVALHGLASWRRLDKIRLITPQFVRPSIKSNKNDSWTRAIVKPLRAVQGFVNPKRNPNNAFGPESIRSVRCADRVRDVYSSAACTL